MRVACQSGVAALLLASCLHAQETHSHPAPEKLGKVSFDISCTSAVRNEFVRGIALLHSFAYEPARKAFGSVAERDPKCAIAHWGAAMSWFHQLWDPPLSPPAITAGAKEIALATTIGGGSDRERGFIQALALMFQDTSAPYSARALAYERAMHQLAGRYEQDAEVQVFYALALLANASPADKTHFRQKQAAALLETLSRAYPDHPGIIHYLIHACDNQELATRGLPAARAYARIAPSAPHALHMPSHIFTRLGLWQDSILSNLAASDAAHQQGDVGEELHAMDYLVYAYLQAGRDEEAKQVVAQLSSMPGLDQATFKVAYAAAAIPVRYAVERAQWGEAAALVPVPGAPPHVAAITVWAAGIALARTGKPDEALQKAGELKRLENQLRVSGSDYWAGQTEILRREVMAWAAQAGAKKEEAVAMMRVAADEEDALEKLPVTPGPIIPAREQLGSLLLEQGRPGISAKEFKTALENTPGRRGALQGLARASDKTAAPESGAHSDLR
jgi:hypothetical protein